VKRLEGSMNKIKERGRRNTLFTDR
jgi:hypothetical protein